MALPPLGEHEEVITFNPVVLRQIENLDEMDQKNLSKGIADIYSKLLVMFVDVQTQSYIHISKLITINCLINLKTSFYVTGFVISIEICPETFNWRVCSLIDKKSAENYQIHKIS